MTNAQKRELKAHAARLEPMLKIGHAGVSAAFLASLDAALATHGLVKIRFTDHKEEKKRLAAEIAAQSGSELIHRVGHVAVYWREPREPRGS